MVELDQNDKILEGIKKYELLEAKDTTVPLADDTINVNEKKLKN